MNVRRRNRGYGSSRSGMNNSYRNQNNYSNRNSGRNREYDEDYDIRAERDRGYYEDEYSPSYGGRRRDRNVFERTGDMFERAGDRIRDKWENWRERNDDDDRDRDYSRDRDYDYEDRSYNRNIEGYNGGYSDSYNNYDRDREEYGGRRGYRNEGRSGWNDNERNDYRNRNEGSVYGVNQNNYDRYNRDRRPYGSENNYSPGNNYRSGRRRRRNTFSW
jgi:hypothetical protein